MKRARRRWRIKLLAKDFSADEFKARFEAKRAHLPVNHPTSARCTTTARRRRRVSGAGVDRRRVARRTTRARPAPLAQYPLRNEIAEALEKRKERVGIASEGANHVTKTGAKLLDSASPSGGQGGPAPVQFEAPPNKTITQQARSSDLPYMSPKAEGENATMHRHIARAVLMRWHG